MNLYQYFDRISIIHLPDRRDRFKSCRGNCGVSALTFRPLIQVPHAPRPADLNGWPSRGVCGNFLSHLGDPPTALKDGLQTIWVLEDDAIFSRRMRREQRLAGPLGCRRVNGACAFLGTRWRTKLAKQPTGLECRRRDFIWATLLRCPRSRAAADSVLSGTRGRTAQWPSGWWQTLYRWRIHAVSSVKSGRGDFSLRKSRVVGPKRLVVPVASTILSGMTR